MKPPKTFLEHLPPDLLVPIETVEHYMGVKKATIKRMAHGRHTAGKLPYVDFGQRTMRFRVRDVLAFVEQRYRE